MTKKELTEKRRRIKLLRYELKLKNQKRKDITKERKEIDKQIASLRDLRDLYIHLGVISARTTIEKNIGVGDEMSVIKSVKEMGEFERNAVYIVSAHKGYTVELIHLFQLLKKGKKDAQGLNLDNVLKAKHFGDDGIEVTFNVGDLLNVNIEDNPNGGLAIHLANVGPADDTGANQLALAHSILGITGTIKITSEVTTVEGQFRRLSLLEMLNKKGAVN